MPNPITRRTVLGAAAATAGAAGLTACGGGSSSTSSTAGAGSASSTPSSSAAAPSTSASSAAATGASSSAAGAAGIVALADVPVGGAVAATLDGKKIVVSQPTKGQVVAFSAICTHQGCTVAPKGAKLDCPCHASSFDAATGKVLGGPAPAPLPAVQVKVAGDQVVPA